MRSRLLIRQSLRPHQLLTIKRHLSLPKSQKQHQTLMTKRTQSLLLSLKQTMKQSPRSTSTPFVSHLWTLSQILSWTLVNRSQQLKRMLFHTQAHMLESLTQAATRTHLPLKLMSILYLPKLLRQWMPTLTSSLKSSSMCLKLRLHRPSVTKSWPLLMSS